MDLSPAAGAFGDRPAADVLADLQTVPDACLSPLPSADEGWTRDPASGAELLDLSRIVPDPEQPRQQLDQDELLRLAESVQRHGLLAPVRVQWIAERGVWMLVAGERRWRAAEVAGLTRIPAVRASAALTEAEALEEQLAEQLLRSEWNPIEEARAYRRLCVVARWSQRELAERCHLHRNKVNRALQLLELDGRVQDLVAAGRVKPSAALELIGLPPGNQVSLAERIAGAGLTAAETAEIASEPAVSQIGTRPIATLPARCKRPRIVVKHATGHVIVVGDLGDGLKALRAHHRQQQAANQPEAEAA